MTVAYQCNRCKKFASEHSQEIKDDKWMRFDYYGRGLGHYFIAHLCIECRKEFEQFMKGEK